MIDSFKAVFFDAGGTLFRAWPSVGELYQEVAAKYGCQAEAKKLEELFFRIWFKRDGLTELEAYSDEKVERDWWRGIVYEVFSQVGLPHDFESFFAELYDRFAMPASWQLYPEALEVLLELKRRGKRLGIISNWDSRLFRLCDGLGITGCFDFILASAVFGHAKPSPKIFEEGLRLSGMRAGEVVHVGDSFEDDIVGAARAGIRPVLVDRHSLPQACLPKPSVEFEVIRQLKELLGPFEAGKKA